MGAKEKEKRRSQNSEKKMVQAQLAARGSSNFNKQLNVSIKAEMKKKSMRECDPDQPGFEMDAELPPVIPPPLPLPDGWTSYQAQTALGVKTFYFHQASGRKTWSYPKG